MVLRRLLSAFNSRSKGSSKKHLDGTPLNMCNMGESHTGELLAIMINVLLEIAKETRIMLVITGCGLFSKGEFLLFRSRSFTNERNVPL